ncbi:MAG: hypothetical protein JKY34_12650 [Kordiimonadaceae bacterium]|nr:hypothetical protein [Kordiimonadaceae bacterium]PCJ37792.1 MAG: hypothetical protein COA75_03470 [Cellvibrionales bacterium]
MNPFLREQVGRGAQVVDVVGRCDAVAEFSLQQCRNALFVPDLQATVQQAIGRRIRYLKKQPENRI